MDNLWIIYGYGWWFQIIWKIWKSIGMMTLPIYGKIKNVPNHQLDYSFLLSHRHKKSKSVHIAGPKDNNKIQQAHLREWSPSSLMSQLRWGSGECPGAIGSFGCGDCAVQRARKNVQGSDPRMKRKMQQVARVASGSRHTRLQVTKGHSAFIRIDNLLTSIHHYYYYIYCSCFKRQTNESECCIPSWTDITTPADPSTHSFGFNASFFLML